MSLTAATGAYNWDWIVPSGLSSVNRGVAFDGSGNIFTIGTAGSGTNFGGGARTSLGSALLYIVMLNPAGAWQWDHTFAPPSIYSLSDCAVDSAGDVVASGYFRDTMECEPGPGVTNLVSNGSNPDPFVIKVDGPTGLW